MPGFTIGIRRRLTLDCCDRILNLLHRLTAPCIERTLSSPSSTQQIFFGHLETIPPKRGAESAHQPAVMCGKSNAINCIAKCQDFFYSPDWVESNW